MNVHRHDAVLSPLYERLLGEQFGLIDHLDVTLRDRGDAIVYTGRTVHPDLDPLFPYDNPIDIEVGGKGDDIHDCLVTALGEFVERYALCLPMDETIETGSYEEIADNSCVFDFDYLVVHAQDEPARSSINLAGPLTRETVLSWTTGHNLVTGAEWAIPAQLVWLSPPSSFGQTDRYFTQTSNGVAAHGTVEQALINAIYETIERDAFMRTWYTQSAPPRIDLTTIPEIKQFVDDRLPHSHRAIHVFELAGPTNVPVYGCALVNDRDEFPKFYMGSAADIDPYQAIKDAIFEVFQASPSIEQLRDSDRISNLDAETHISNLSDNVLLYCYPEYFEHVEFLVSGEYEPVDPFSPLESNSEYEILLSELIRAECSPVAVDITLPDIRDVGFSVVSVTIPELVSLAPPGQPPIEHPAFENWNISPVPPHPFP